MANEIGQNFTTGLTLYACRFRANGEVFLTDGSASETWGASGHTANDYDVPLNEIGSSGHYVGHFDASDNIADGDYKVCIYIQAGANPANSDVSIAQGIISWYDDDTLSLRRVLVIILAAIAALSALVALLPSASDIREEIDANSTQLAAIVADTNELQTDWTDGGRLDLLLDAIKKYTDLIVLLETDVNDANTTTDFNITDGNETDDYFNSLLVMVQDANDSHWETRLITDYTSGRQLSVNTAFTFTPTTDDLVYIMNWQFLDNMWDKLQRLGSTTNIIDATKTSVGGSQGLGATYLDASGLDP